MNSAIDETIAPPDCEVGDHGPGPVGGDGGGRAGAGTAPAVLAVSAGGPGRAAPAPSPAVLARAAGMLRAAGDPARLALLALLADGERCVTEIAAHSGDAMPTVSQRLRLLRTEGLVRARRDGKHVFYVLADAHVHDLLDNVLRHAGEGGGR